MSQSQMQQLKLSTRGVRWLDVNIFSSSGAGGLDHGGARSQEPQIL